MPDPRQALADAIAKRSALEARLHALLQAEERRSAGAGERFAALASADEDLATARDNAPRQLVAALLGDAANFDTLAEAEAAVLDAQYHIDQSAEAMQLLEAERRTIEIELAGATAAVNSAVGVVLAASPEVAALLSALHEAEAVALDLRRALYAIGQHAIISVPPVILQNTLNAGPGYADWSKSIYALKYNSNTLLPALKSDHFRKRGAA